MTRASQAPTKARLGPSGRAAMELLACCPRIPTDVVATFLGMQHARSAAQLLLRLRAAGLARSQPERLVPLVGSGALRLWALTPAGEAIARRRGLAPSDADRALLPYGRPARWPDVARQQAVPMLVVAYRLLGQVVRGLDRPIRVIGWEHPWVRTVIQAETGRARHVRLPAAAVLVAGHADGELPRCLLLLPDLGTLPLASYRPVLRGLLDLRRSPAADHHQEALLIVGVAAGTVARVAAWQALVQQVAHRAGEAPLRAQVVTCPRERVARGRHVGNQVEQALGLVARHPLLTRQHLATLLGASEARTGRLLMRLRAHGWVRAGQAGDVPPDVLGVRPGQRRRPTLVELTPAGRRAAARRLLLPAAVAARHHGVLGTEASTHQFTRHLAHTVGANAVLVAFVSAAQQARERGGDDALEEWRSAAACARGRFRPDGYGCYRRGGSRFGFFLEFDRGTERPAQYAAKLAAYARYRTSSAARHEYAGFPALLVVTTSAAAEARFAHEVYLAHEQHGAVPLVVFLTTTSRIAASPDGVLGPIWRSAGPAWVAEPARVCWLPRSAPARARALPASTGPGMPSHERATISWPPRAPTAQEDLGAGDRQRTRRSPQHDDPQPPLATRLGRDAERAG